MSIREEMRELGCCVLIPTYNNEKTIKQVINDALEYCSDVFVVNDGATDNTTNIIQQIPKITVYEYKKNKGKGNALKLGLKKVTDLGFRYAITIDSDGQHFVEDLPLFITEIKKHPDSFIIGSRNLNQENMQIGRAHV